jgi:hypothetical protein
LPLTPEPQRVTGILHPPHSLNNRVLAGSSALRRARKFR